LVVEVPVLPQLAAPLAALAAAAVLFLALFRVNYWIALAAAFAAYGASFTWVYGRRLASILRSAAKGTCARPNRHRRLRANTSQSFGAEVLAFSGPH
jgi:hypothetical protein